MRVVWAALAERRAAEAFEYIAVDRPNAAAAWLETMLNRVESLSRFAGRGRVVPEIGRSQYREIFQRPYRIIYRMDADRVVILTIRHGGRAWDATEVSGRT